ncbi:MAG TPA: hypothetical protein VFE23_21060 [Usitatibacter sp.]|jgi:hypothetical protein|nr:hypothetical protein [Usitatibacter sp.]
MQATRRFGQDIELRFDDTRWSVREEEGVREEAIAGRARTGAADGAAWIAQRVVSAGLARAATPVPLERLAAVGTRALDADVAPVLHVRLPPEENVVLLVESEGVVAWQFPDDSGLVAGSRRPRAEAIRDVRFTVVEPMRAGVAHAAAHAAFAGWPVQGLQIVVLRMLARPIAGGIVNRLEGRKHEGPVVVDDAADPSRWDQLDAFPFLKAVPNGPARILLFVHGSFSSVRSAFGGLCATAPGRAFLDAAHQRYAAVWGWDHRTLSVDPRANAVKLYEALAAVTVASPPVIDVVCHSRGALVVRSLVEEVLPGKTWRPAIGRVIFAAGANAGTLFARPANWHALLDLATNLVLADRRALSLVGAAPLALAAGEAIEYIADFVGCLVDGPFVEAVAPGLAAMDPDGAFVHEINGANPGEPAPDACEYYAIESDFEARLADGATQGPPEFPRRLVLLLANGFVDALMQGAANDLLVDVRSMTSINPPAREVRAVQDFGRNARVYHTNYFLQPPTVEALVRWLLAARGAGGAIHPQARAAAPA